MDFHQSEISHYDSLWIRHKYILNHFFQDGDVRLTYHIYKLSFLNFLLGKQPNGPGQYIFGTVLPAQPYCMFPIDYSALNASEEDIEPFRW